MSPDDYQKAWQAASAKTRVSIDANSLRDAVARNERELRTAVSWSDFGELAIWALLLPVWIYLGVTTASPWTWYLMVPAIVWGAGLKLGLRARLKKRPCDPDASLVNGVVDSLVLVEHQIWSRRDAFWWIQLPSALAMMAFFLHVSWQRREEWEGALLLSAVGGATILVIYGFTYYKGRRVVRRELEPRRQELLALLASLRDEKIEESRDEYPLIMGGEFGAGSCCTPSPRRMLIAGVVFVVLLALGVGGILVARSLEEGYPKESPFTAVRWADTEPEVEVNGEWFVLMSLNGIPADEIVAFSQRTYGTLWRKRFEEDLVELLSRMGHAPDITVDLELQPTERTETMRLEDVPMTRANRKAIRDAAKARARDEHLPEEKTESSMNDLNAEVRDFSEGLERIRLDYGFPAMTAFTLRGVDVVDRGTVGTRSRKSDIPVAADAPWHLGSNTKAMTATVAGVLVEEGLLTWDSTVGDILGEVAPDMNTAHRDVTLTMLLQHRSGLLANLSWYTAPEDRIACAAEILATSPIKPGTYAYSNAGYVVAGAMMEVVTGKRWEELMEEKLFEPLGMVNSSFGAPSKPGAPWGHRKALFGWRPVAPDTREADNALVLGPAGTVHATLDDYAKFVAAHLAGARGEDGIVSAETFATLHTPPEGGDYAMGWMVLERGWAGGRALSHSGSNTMWFATVWIAPEKNLAYFGATNVGGKKAFGAVDKVITALIARQDE